MTRSAAVFALILVAAAVLRFNTAIIKPFISDEDTIAVPLADRISFSPANPNLPVRGLHHPALPSYFVRLSVTLFGASRLGYRALDVFAGLFCIVLIFRLARDWYGTSTGLWAVALLAFNEYHIIVSSLATAKGPHLLFVTIAIYVFARFLSTGRPGSLYGAVAAVGFAFYCKEHSVLILLAFALTLLMRPYRHWLSSRHLYWSGVLFAVMITPDVIANVRAQPDPITLGTSDAPATYSDHLSRVGGLGLSPYGLMFFGRDGLNWVAAKVLGSPIDDATPEYRSMNSGFGFILLASVCARTLLRTSTEKRFLVVLFWVVFSFFSLIRPGQPSNNMDPVTWYWVDATLFPAVILAGSILASASNRFVSIAFRVTAVIAMAYAVVRMTLWLDVS